MDDPHGLYSASPILAPMGGCRGPSIAGMIHSTPTEPFALQGGDVYPSTTGATRGTVAGPSLQPFTAVPNYGTTAGPAHDTGGGGGGDSSSKKEHPEGEDKENEEPGEKSKGKEPERKEPKGKGKEIEQRTEEELQFSNRAALGAALKAYAALPVATQLKAEHALRPISDEELAEIMAREPDEFRQRMPHAALPLAPDEHDVHDRVVALARPGEAIRVDADELLMILGAMKLREREELLSGLELERDGKAEDMLDEILQLDSSSQLLPRLAALVRFLYQRARNREAQENAAQPAVNVLQPLVSTQPAVGVTSAPANIAQPSRDFAQEFTRRAAAARQIIVGVTTLKDKFSKLEGSVVTIRLQLANVVSAVGGQEREDFKRLTAQVEKLEPILAQVRASVGRLLEIAERETAGPATTAGPPQSTGQEAHGSQPAGQGQEAAGQDAGDPMETSGQGDELAAQPAGQESTTTAVQETAAQQATGQEAGDPMDTSGQDAAEPKEKPKEQQKPKEELRQPSSPSKRRKLSPRQPTPQQVSSQQHISNLVKDALIPLRKMEEESSGSGGYPG